MDSTLGLQKGRENGRYRSWQNFFLKKKKLITFKLFSMIPVWVGSRTLKIRSWIWNKSFRSRSTGLNNLSYPVFIFTNCRLFSVSWAPLHVLSDPSLFTPTFPWLTGAGGRNFTYCLTPSLFKPTFPWLTGAGRSFTYCLTPSLFKPTFPWLTGVGRSLHTV